MALKVIDKDIVVGFDEEAVPVDARSVWASVGLRNDACIILE